MNISKSILTLVLCIAAGFAQSQITLSRQVIGSTGGTVNTSIGEISFNVGEPMVRTETASSISLTQGFEQIPYSLEATPVNFNASNAFSPNSDGVNDIWAISGITNFGENSVRIYNRWGDEVASFENYNNFDIAWDGTTKSGHESIEGTYFYVIEFDGVEGPITGWVQITR